MNPLKSLRNGELLALKIALDGYQRFESHPEAVVYFYKIVDYLIGPVDRKLPVWELRTAITAEDDRRSKALPLQIKSDAVYADLKKLSEREMTVLKMISDGFSTKEMADVLHIAYRTVTNHKKHIVQKLGLGSVMSLPKFARDHLSE